MIYFVQDPTDFLIKIGTTICLSSRLKALEFEYRVKLNVLGVTDGSYADEAALHARFVLLHDQGEWFKPGRALLDFIAADCRPWDGVDEVPAKKTGSLRMEPEVLERVRIAAALTGVSPAEYVQRALTESSDCDIKREATKLAAPSPTEANPCP